MTTKLAMDTGKFSYLCPDLFGIFRKSHRLQCLHCALFDFQNLLKNIRPYDPKNFKERALRKLNNMVSGFFDFAENRALDHIPTTMQDYRIMLDNILSAGGNPVLTDAGSVSAKRAREKAFEEYRKFQVRTLSPVERAYLASLEAEAKKSKLK